MVLGFTNALVVVIGAVAMWNASFPVCSAAFIARSPMYMQSAMTTAAHW